MQDSITFFTILGVYFMNRFLSVAVAILLLSTQAVAGDAKIAVVDIQKIVAESSATKDINKQLEKKKNEFQSQINKQEENLMKEDQELAKQKASLSAEAFEKKRKEFQTKVATVQRDVQKKRAQLENAYTDALAKVQKSVIEIIKSMASDKGFSLAIPASQALYYEADMDISAEVLKQLNSKLSSVSVEIKEPKKQ
jgi:Skp family chaperone for outer membrane proteins